MSCDDPDRDHAIALKAQVRQAALHRELAGFFEYHTRDITLNRLESLLYELADGKLTHADILRDGGHGAYVRRSIGFDAVDIILATGHMRRAPSSYRGVCRPAIF